MAAYPATLLTTDASPSRFLTLIDPMLPLSVLYKCVNAYTGKTITNDFSGSWSESLPDINLHVLLMTCKHIISLSHTCSLSGMDSVSVQPRHQLDSLSVLGQDTALFLENVTPGASNWLQSGLDRTSTSPARSSDGSQNAMPHSTNMQQGPREFPEGFEPLRSGCLAEIHLPCTPIMKNPFVSPLLASDSLLRGLPPVHLVVRTRMKVVGKYWEYKVGSKKCNILEPYTL